MVCLFYLASGRGISEGGVGASGGQGVLGLGCKGPSTPELTATAIKAPDFRTLQSPKGPKTWLAAGLLMKSS